MRKLSWLAGLALLGCDWQALAPGDKCWWQYTKSAVVWDTVWNQVPNADMPYILVGHQKWTDSTRVCR